MSGIIFIIEMFLIIILSNQYIAISLWLITVMMLQSSLENGNEHIYRQIIEYYPKNDCITPRLCTFLFKKLEKLSMNGIPKEMYFSEIIKFIGLCLYTLITIVFVFLNQKIACIVGVFYILIAYTVNIICIFIMTKKQFIVKFKKINRYNWKYFFVSDDEISFKHIGKCSIMWTFQKGNKTFAMITMEQTNEIKENVLVLGKLELDKSNSYDVYEICNVYYIE